MSCFAMALASPASADPGSLALGGDAAPDGNGTFQSFGTPTINASGQVAVVGVLTGTQSPPNDQRGVYLLDGQSVTQLVRGGDPAPDGNGVFYYFGYDLNMEERLALNAGGTVAFLAQLTGTSGGPTFDDSGLFSANTSGVTQLVRLGDPAPDGNGVFGPQDPTSIEQSLLPPGLDDTGEASFFALLFQTSGGEGVDDNGVFRADSSSVTRVARAGGLAPGGSDTFETIDPQIASNAAGEVALRATLFWDFMGGPPPPDFERIYVSGGSTLTEVFRSGTPPPDADGMIAGSQEIILAESGSVVFQGFVTDTANVLDSGTRLFLTDGATLSEIARQGELGPGEVDFRFAYFVGTDANGQDQVAFSSTLERNVAPPGNRTSAIYLYDDTSGLSLLVREGDPAPDGNGTLGDLAGPVFLNENGEIAFGATVNGVANPPVGSYGIFVVQPNGSVRQVVRSGQPLEGSTVLSLLFLGNFVFDTDDLSLAGMTALNDAGQVAFTASLADGRWGVFVEPVPEPSSAALAAAALATVAVLRRRVG